MKISVLDNPTDELVDHLATKEKERARKLRKLTNCSPNYRMGYGAYLNGFRPNQKELNGYEEIYRGYAKGWRDAKRQGNQTKG